MFVDAADANDTISLLMRYWNSIVADFRDEVVHLGYIEDPGTDNIPGRDWAREFMQGTYLSGTGWSSFFGDENEALAITIPLIAGEVDPQWPPEPLTNEKGTELLQSLFAAAGRAYRYFEPDRRSSADASPDDDAFEYPETYVRDRPKIGRNETCPCGSGKKFKRCCGSADLGPRH